MKKIFISYSHNDYHKIPEVINMIKRKMPEFRDAEVWDPISHLTGDADFRKEIHKQINSSDAFVILWTKEAASSMWSLYEAGMASGLGIPMLVVVEPDSPEPIAPLSKFQTIKMEKES